MWDRNKSFFENDNKKKCTPNKDFNDFALPLKIYLAV